MKAELENLSKQDDKEIIGFDSHMLINGQNSEGSKQTTTNREDKEVAVSG